MGEMSPHPVSDAGAPTRTVPKPAPWTWPAGVRGGGQEIGNGMLRNPCSLPPVRLLPAHIIHQRQRRLLRPHGAPVPEAQSRGRRAMGNTCGAVCAAGSRRGALPAVGGCRVGPAGGQGAWPALVPMSLEGNSQPHPFLGSSWVGLREHPQSISLQK